jgi:hypothetical protein
MLQGENAGLDAVRLGVIERFRGIGDFGRLQHGSDLAVDAGFQLDVGDLLLPDEGHHPGPDRPGAVEVLALRHVEFGVPHPVADRAFVAERECGDVIERRGLGNTPAALADDNDDLALVVELQAFGRTDPRLLMPGERAREANEQRRIGGSCLPFPILFVAVGKIDADANDLFGRRDGISKRISASDKLRARAEASSASFVRAPSAMTSRSVGHFEP